MEITSEKALIEAPIKEVFEYLSDAANIEALLPEDKISDFRSDENGCTFKVQGGFTISLLHVYKVFPKEINMKSGEKAPFDYTLTIRLKEVDGHTEGHMNFEGDVNMFLRMMVEKPLTALFNSMAKKLQEQF
jgi:carbon monoxide dehydrogenase subunit G